MSTQTESQGKPQETTVIEPTIKTKTVQAITNEALKENCAQGTSISSAFFWSTTGSSADSDSNLVGSSVPRPDRNLSTLRILSLWGGVLGLDHFYLRSPLSGFVKLLTFGGVGMWWLWDVAQTWFESQRVLNYGIVTPFDLMVNIGQGMITDKTCCYKQESNFSLWMFAVIFGFLGIDMFVLDRFWLGIRKLILFLIVWNVIQSIYANGIFSSIYNGGFWLNIFNFVVLFFALGIFMLWYANVRLLMTPDKIMTEGIVYSNVVKDSLGWIRKLYEDDTGSGIKPELASEWNIIHKHYSVNDISGSTLRELFKIRHISESMKKDEGQGKEKETGEGSAGWPPLTIAKRIIAYIWRLIVDECSKIKESISQFVFFNFTPPGIAINTIIMTATSVLSKTGIDLTKLNFNTIQTDISNVVNSIKDKASDAVEKINKKYGENENVVERVVLALLQGSSADKIFTSLKHGVKLPPITAIPTAQTVLKPNTSQTAHTVPTVPAASPAAQTVTATKPNTPAEKQSGGSRSELSSESQILGATVIALVAGGSLKGLIDYLMAQD